MLSITSCGMRIDICFDLSLTVFLTMSVYLMIWCDSVYTKNESQKGLTCDSLETNLNHTSLLWCDSQRQRPGVLGTTTEASNHNVTEAYIMACSHDTQTRPKFQYHFDALARNNLTAGAVRVSVEADTLVEARQKIKVGYTTAFYRGRQAVQPVRPEFTYLFLGTPSDKPNTTPVVLRVEANTEQQARSHFLNWNLVFAAQIRTKAPCRLQLMDGSDHFTWIFEQRFDACTSGVQEVVHV
ncbi:host cell division inhibitor Icd-like protein [Salmonella enterica]